MAIVIESRTSGGKAIHRYEAVDVSDAVHYMTEQAGARFVDGYSVGGFGIVRIASRYPNKRGGLAIVTFSWLIGVWPNAGRDAGAMFIDADGATLHAHMTRKMAVSI